MDKIIIGARGSKLSLIQTDIVKNQLQKLLPKTAIEIKTITTKGDKNMSPVPLDSVGKGWFTKEIDKALLVEEIDIAVHSLKDLSEELPTGLVIAAIPTREDAREALVAKNNVNFSQLPQGAIIGTDSTRRKAQILNKRPDLIVESVRGNVITRLEKLDSGQYDALFLAVAGLKRLELEQRITEYFPVIDIIPSPGQGALAVVVKETNRELVSLLKKLNDTETVTAVHAEREFSKTAGGGCKMPVGAYAEVKGKSITIYGVIGSLDGKHIEKNSIHGATVDADKLAITLANKLLKISKPWYQSNEEIASQYIVITRPSEEDNQLKKQIEALGFQTYLYPTITTEKNSLTPLMMEQLQNLHSFDWILFTSRNGVSYFIEALHELNIDISVLQTKQIGAVGEKTKEALENFGISVHFIPSKFSTEILGKEIKSVRGKKILLPRSNIANQKLTKILHDKGAHVVNIPIYKTEYVYQENSELISLVNEGKVQMITFTSPSTIDGFIKSFPQTLLKKVLSLQILSIGPVTTAKAKKSGFANILTADIYTTSGMVAKLKENIL